MKVTDSSQFCLKITNNVSQNVVNNSHFGDCKPLHDDLKLFFWFTSVSVLCDNEINKILKKSQKYHESLHKTLLSKEMLTLLGLKTRSKLARSLSRLFYTKSVCHIQLNFH